MSHIFICYSHKNKAFAQRIEADLQARGYRVWRDESVGIDPQQWQSEVERALDAASAMVAILSPDSLRSCPVNHEIEYALNRNLPIVGVQYMACQAHPKLSHVEIIDFTMLDDDPGGSLGYLHAVEKLLHAIDQTQPILHYLNQIAEINVKIRQLATKSFIQPMDQMQWGAV